MLGKLPFVLGVWCLLSKWWVRKNIFPISYILKKVLRCRKNYFSTTDGNCSSTIIFNTKGVSRALKPRALKVLSHVYFPEGGTKEFAHPDLGNIRERGDRDKSKCEMHHGRQYASISAL